MVVRIRSENYYFAFVAAIYMVCQPVAYGVLWYIMNLWVATKWRARCEYDLFLALKHLETIETSSKMAGSELETMEKGMKTHLNLVFRRLFGPFQAGVHASRLPLAARGPTAPSPAPRIAAAHGRLGGHGPLGWPYELFGAAGGPLVEPYGAHLRPISKALRLFDRYLRPQAFFKWVGAKLFVHRVEQCISFLWPRVCVPSMQCAIPFATCRLDRMISQNVCIQLFTWYDICTSKTIIFMYAI